MAAQYRYLVFARGRGWEVDVDGITTPGRGSTASEVLEQHYADHVLAPHRTAATATQRRWDDELRRLSAQVGRRPVDRQRGSIGGRTTQRVVVLSFPGGQVVECPPDQADQRISQHVQTLVGPRPEVRVATYEEWRRSVRASARQVLGWTCTTVEPDGSSRLINIDLGESSHGAPLSAITVLLNSFAEDGWTVASTGEDKVQLPEGYDGEDAGEVPARLRFLLVRTLS